MLQQPCKECASAPIGFIDAHDDQRSVLVGEIGITCEAEMLAELGAEGNRRESGDSGSRTEARGKEATQ